MNRLHHLKQTLPKNIEDSLSYGHIEFVLLNYNSQDGMDEWVTTELSTYIAKGILVYIKTEEPESFLVCHAKNIATKHASGEIVCNVDADNFIGKGFAEYINTQFIKNNNIFLCVDIKTSPGDFYGRICSTKEDFVTLSGYDRDLEGYGFEDYDLNFRLELLGRKRNYIPTEANFLNAITHTMDERMSNDPYMKNIKGVYGRYINYYTTDFLYLFKDETFVFGRLLFNRYRNATSIDNLFTKFNTDDTLHEQMIILDGGNWVKGDTTIENDVIKLYKENALFLTLKKTNGKILKQIPESNDQREFEEITHPQDATKRVSFFTETVNIIKMNKNRYENILAPNGDNFGIDPIYKYQIDNKKNNDSPWIMI